jgi:hypothetical protein
VNLNRIHMQRKLQMLSEDSMNKTNQEEAEGLNKSLTFPEHRSIGSLEDAGRSDNGVAESAPGFLFRGGEDSLFDAESVDEASLPVERTKPLPETTKTGDAYGLQGQRQGRADSMHQSSMEIDDWDSLPSLLTRLACDQGNA